jgi:very-short-patch-repair endonuclease
MGYYCNECKKTISEAEYKYSTQHYGRALCYGHQKNHKQSYSTSSNKRQIPKTYPQSKYNSKITPQARRLSDALKRRGIKHKLEAYDGYKHVDISIEWANLNIEIDGKQHSLDAKQLYADLERDSFSNDDGIVTKRFTNEMIDNHVEQVADVIAKVAKRRYREDSLF